MKTKIKIGDYNELAVVKTVDFGLYLDGGSEWGQILMPQRYVSRPYQTGEQVRVFVYTDSEDRVIATTETPKAKVGEFAFLEVVHISPIGAFLDWGLAKDLFMPLGEQKRAVYVGDKLIVAVYLDTETNRPAASARLSQFISSEPAAYKKGEEVSLLITNRTDIGFRAVVNHEHWGVIFKSDIFEPVKVGEFRRGYVKQVRSDGKVDLILHQPGDVRVDDLEAVLLEKLDAAEGFLPLTDKTDPQIIYETFRVSKKTFKRAVGALYKKRQITIEEDGIHRVKGTI